MRLIHGDTVAESTPEGIYLGDQDTRLLHLTPEDCRWLSAVALPAALACISSGVVLTSKHPNREEAV